MLRDKNVHVIKSLQTWRVIYMSTVYFSLFSAAWMFFCSNWLYYDFIEIWNKQTYKYPVDFFEGSIFYFDVLLFQLTLL